MAESSQPARDAKRAVSDDSSHHSDGSGASASDPDRPRKRPKLPSWPDQESSQDEGTPAPRVHRGSTEASTRPLESLREPSARVSTPPRKPQRRRRQRKRRGVSYAARYRLAASRHFVDVPRHPAQEHLQALADSTRGVHEDLTDRPENRAVNEIESEQDNDENLESPAPRRYLGNIGFKDPFHRAEVDMATAEAFQFNQLVDGLNAHGALGPGPNAGGANERLRLANICAARDILHRFPRAPPRSLEAHEPRLKHAYRMRYKSYAALYHRNASAAWPQPSMAQADGPTLAEQVAGMVDRRWRQSLQATFTSLSDDALSNSESETSSLDSPLSVPPSASERVSAEFDSEPGSDVTRSASHSSGSSSPRVSNIGSVGSARSSSGSLSEGSAAKATPSSSLAASNGDPATSSPASRAPSSPGIDSGSDEGGPKVNMPHDHSHLLSSLEMVDCSPALTEPLVASIDADLRKVYALMPLLVARRRQTGPAAHASHSHPEPERFESAAQWGYEGPMLDWRDMLILLQSNGGRLSQSCSGHEETQVAHDDILSHTTESWPSVVPSNDPRRNALLRTFDRLKKIYEPSDTDGDLTGPSLPTNTLAADPEDDDLSVQSKEKKPFDSAGSGVSAAMQEAWTVRSDLFSLPLPSKGSRWPTLSEEVLIPV